MKYVQSFKDRHGKARYYFRRPGYPALALPGLPGEYPFQQAYDLANSRGAPVPRKGRRGTTIIPRWLAEENAGVYFVRAGEAVKIGYSSNVRERLIDLQIGSSLPIEVLLVLPGDKRSESKFHQQFVDHRIHGEWFSLEGKLAEFVSLERTNRQQVWQTIGA